MKFKRNSFLFFIVTIVIMISCCVLISLYSGFEHSASKFKSIWVYTFLVVMGLFLIADPIKFLLLAIDAATWPLKETKYNISKETTAHTQRDFLKMRLNTLRSKLIVTEEHRNEPLNLKYRLIANDLWLYGTLFLLLLGMVLVTQTQLLYQNTNHMQRIFFENRTYSMGLKEIKYLGDIYYFIESSLINPFNTIEPSDTGEFNWLYGDHTAKLGVIRLRQLRRKENHHIGWGDIKFSSSDYMATWELPYRRTPYTDKYWHIYDPWLPTSKTYGTMEKFFGEMQGKGHLQIYPQLMGYATLLARSRNNSMKVINYLKSHNWLTRNTSVLFMEFTLYSGDANIFSLCSLLVEQTPFGTLLKTVDITSCKLKILDQLSIFSIILAMIYVLVLLVFSKNLVVTIWYEPSNLRSMWNKLDIIILILNVAVVCAIITQEVNITPILEKVESASVLEYLDFRTPNLLHSVINVLVGFLVCLTTLRLWKVLQFASVFQMFSVALYSAWQALASTALIICIFLMAFGIAVAIINGNNAKSFSHVLKSIISSLCFTFGFTSQITPQDLFFGGKILGLIFYILLTFVLFEMLINLFVSIVHGYFEHAKNTRDPRNLKRINFLQFLRVEYAPFFNMLHKLPRFNRSYRRQNRTVAQNIKRRLDAMDRANFVGNKFKSFYNISGKIAEMDETLKHKKYTQKIEKLFTVASIIQTQMEYLEYLLLTEDSPGNAKNAEATSKDTDDDDEDGDDDDYDSQMDYDYDNGNDNANKRPGSSSLKK